MEVITNYFVNGIFKKVIPKEADKYQATIFNIDGVRYDLLNEKDLRNLPCPDQKKLLNYTTNRIDYILRMCSKNIYKNDEEQGLLAILAALNMMIKSKFWLHENYLDLIKLFYKSGRIEQAEKLESVIDKEIVFGHTVKLSISSNEKDEELELKKPRQLWLEEKQYYYLRWKYPRLCPKSKNAYRKLKIKNKKEYDMLRSLIPDNYTI